MAGNFNSSNGNVCSVFDTYPYVIVAAVSSGSAMISALCCVFVIGLIFLFKKHYFFIQRLILYHCLATLLRSFSTILRLHRLGYQNDSAVINALCVISGFTNQLTIWFLIMDYLVLTFTLLMAAVFQKNLARLEGLFIVLIFIFPLTFNWIPFINNSYGRSGAWCSIRDLNYDDCTVYEFGITLRTAIQSIPQFVLLVSVTPTLLFIIIFLSVQRYHRRDQYKDDQETKVFKKHLNEQVLPLLFFPFGVLLLNIIPLINRIYELSNLDNPSYALWIISAILSPLQGGFIAVVYTLDRDTLKRLTYTNLVVLLCKRSDAVREYPMEQNGQPESTLGSETPYLHSRDTLEVNSNSRTHTE